jgi:transcriptional regulatory protein LevR
VDFNERFELYLAGGMINENDIKDVNSIINMFKEEYGVTLSEENAATFIAHICAAYSRLNTDEMIEELPLEIVNQLKGLKTYELSLEVFEKVVKVTNNPITEIEKGYFLLHINNLISAFKADNQWN